MFKVGSIVGWKDGEFILFALLVTREPDSCGLFEAITIMSKHSSTSVGDIGTDWYKGSYTGSVNWVQLGLREYV